MSTPMLTLTRGGAVLAGRVCTARRLGARLRGLIGRRTVPGDGLLLDPCGSIHTCFMLIPIDVVFLARDGRVLATRPNLRPWRFAFAPLATRRALETACGFIARHGIMPGDVLTLEPARGP